MMKAGMKNKAMLTSAQIEKPIHRFVFRFKVGSMMFGIFNDYLMELGRTFSTAALQSAANLDSRLFLRSTWDTEEYQFRML